MIPVPIAEALAGLNLPAEMASNPIFGEHAPLVMNYLEWVMLPEAYGFVTGVEGTESADGAAALGQIIQQVYGFLLLASTLEFLNIKTLGQGIIKVVGLDSTQTELLSGAAVESMRKRLVRRALNAIFNWLSAEGLAELYKLDRGRPNKLRASVI